MQQKCHRCGRIQEGKLAAFLGVCERYLALLTPLACVLMHTCGRYNAVHLDQHWCLSCAEVLPNLA